MEASKSQHPQEIKNDTFSEFPRDLRFDELFDEQAGRSPNETAVIFEGESLNYRELQEKSNQIARYLQKRGIGPEVLVGVGLHRSLHMIAGLIGVNKAGGAYVPLDVHFPQERLQYLVEDSGPKVILTDESNAHLWRHTGAELVYLDRDWPQIEEESTTTPSTAATAESTMYVIYTSGSTGRPKGVQLTHRNFVNFVCSMKQEPGITEADTLLAVTTISFDIAALEMFLPLVVGARIVLATRDTARVSATLSRAIEEHNVTIMQTAPTSWRLLLEGGWKGKRDLKALCGGEALTRDLADALLKHTGELWNMYGPTETTVWSTIHRVLPFEENVPIGRPIANTQVYILDDQLQPVPDGEVGELCIGGEGVARGYLHKPELTAERFVANPIPGEPSARVYRTGDLARYLPWGGLECLGRVDNQIKIHGVRVEPGEIEMPIVQYPGMKQALVVAREDVPGEKHLVAYIIPEHPSRLHPAELRGFLKAKLPEYLIPSHFVPLEEFPMTLNGKIDRKALPAPTAPGGKVTEVADGPKDDIEYQLVTIWEQVLRLKPIGLNDNFFDLGGHSLLAARLVTRIEQTLSADLPMASFLDAPTIAQQADLIRIHKNGGPTKAANSRVATTVVRNGSSGFGSAIPLFYLGGDPTFRPLSQRLRALHDFHSLGMQASILRSMQGTPSLEAISKHFVRAIRERRPHGPYMLGGWCAHGLLALETAQQLREQGDDVALVIMLETVNPRRLDERAKWVHWATRMQLKLNLLEFEYAYVRSLGREQARDYVLGRLERKIAGIERSFRNSGPRPGVHEDLDQRNLLEVLYAAAGNYCPRSYDGPVALVSSRRKPFGFPKDRSLGWRDLLDGLDIREAEGNHYTMYIEPNVDGLARELNVLLKAAEAGWRQRVPGRNPLPSAQAAIPAYRHGLRPSAESRGNL
jgi:amino acid adenylation domain-containing protein